MNEAEKIKSEIRRFYVDTLREIDELIDEIPDYPAGYSKCADAMDAVYIQIRNLLKEMANEAEGK